MTKEDYQFVYRCFLAEPYDTVESPSSIARMFLNRKLIHLYINSQSQCLGTSVKYYIRWLRKLRSILFPLNTYRKYSGKFVSTYGISRRSTMADLLNYINKYSYSNTTT